MQWTERNRHIKMILVAVALVIAALFLIFSHYLVQDLKREASDKMEVWAEAMRTIKNADEDTDLDFVLQVINNNHTIPVVVLNANGDVDQFRNIKLRYDTPQDSVKKIGNVVKKMKSEGYSIRINYGEDSVSTAKPEYIDILYGDSLTLKQLAYYPFIQIAILTVFILIIVVALLSLKRAEQNRVWVGLTKETAHQLGTPISSLMAWSEILKENHPNDPILDEMDKDVSRLNIIADRFSKVGSQPEVKEEDLKEVIWHVVNYVSMRSSNKVQFVCNLPTVKVTANLSSALFEWVIENLCKNAVDAMSGKGMISIVVHEITGMIIIEISDTGKGIPKNKFKTVFAPGYTTKRRGWGLGLSLAKRIIEEYHNGRIFVKSSELGKGTTFRIELPKQG
ncbi:MAG: HAMP domain-containing histidine kinase [Bacteroidaceae bacterium]|nr:HAMP domain-containing histidine kinase [Bacteroidaceae bacterium]